MAGKKGMHKYYVYDVLDGDGTIIYVGKGCNHRMNRSCRHRKGAAAIVIERFESDEAAYAFEKKRIAEIHPPLNQSKGGDGPRENSAHHPLIGWQREMKSIGTRAYAARLLLKIRYVINNFPSKVVVDREMFEWAASVDIGSLKEVAYGNSA